MPRRWPSWICRPGRARSSCAAAVTRTTCRAAISSTRRPARCGRCAFDLARLETRGTPVPVVPDVVTTPPGGVDAVVAGDGTLAYVSGSGGCGGAAHARVGGPAGPRDADPGAAARVSLSAAVTRWHARRGARSRSGARHLGLGSGTHDAHPRHVRPGFDSYPVWTRDGRRVIFSSERSRRPESLLAGGGRHRRGRAADRESQPAECGGRVARRPPADLHGNRPEDGRGRDAAGVGRDPSRDAARAVTVHRAERDRLARRPLARLRVE